jgi:hypothetical protein
MVVPRSAPDHAQADDPTLSLTPALRDSAKAVVSAFTAIDWQVIQQNHDKVFLNFPDATSCDLAEQVIQEIAFANAGLFDSLLQELRTRGRRLAKLQAYIIALVRGSTQVDPRKVSCLPAESGMHTKVALQAEQLNQKSSELQSCITEFMSALEELQAHHSASNRSAILINLNEMLGRAESIRSHVAKKAHSARATNFGSAFPQQPAPSSLDPVQITQPGASGCHHWQLVPIELVVADEVVGMCRNIEFSSLETGKIKVSTDQMAQVQNYGRLFLDCGFARFDVPEDDNPHTAGALQHDLDNLLKALREFLKCLKTPISSVETNDTQEPLKATTYAADIIAGKPDAASKVEPVPTGKCHLIKIDTNFKVTVDGKHYQKERNRRSLIGFAYFSNGTETFDINTQKFLELIEGPERKWNHRWNERKNALVLEEEKGTKGKTFQFFKADGKAQREYRITGLRFVHQLSPEQFKKYFVENPFQTRLRRKEK